MTAFRPPLLLAILFLASSPVYAADKKSNPAFPGVQADGFAIISVNVAQIWDAKELIPFHAVLKPIRAGLLKEFESDFGVPFEEIERLTFYWSSTDTEDGHAEPFRIVRTRKPIKREALLKMVNAVPAEEIDRKEDQPWLVTLAGKNVFFRYSTAYIFADDRTFIVSPYIRDKDLTVLDYLRVLSGATPAVTEGPLAEALAGAEKHTVVAEVEFSRIRTALNRAPATPGEYDPLVALTRAEKAFFAFDFGPAAKAEATVTFFDDATAEKIEPDAKKAIALALGKLAELRKSKYREAEVDAVLLPLFEFGKTALDKTLLKRAGKTLIATTGGETADTAKKTLAVLPPWVSTTADRMKTTENVNKITLGLHSWNDSNETLPRDITDKDGKPLLSWRVRILEFADEALYKKIDLTKAWDDPANKKFAEQTPDVFQYIGRGREEKGMTYFQMLTCAEPLIGGSPMLVPGRKTSLVSITDGTSNSFMVVEGATAVNWLKPGDIPYDPAVRPKLGNPKTGRFLVGMGDGSVRWLSDKKISDATLHALITIDGGEVIRDDD